MNLFSVLIESLYLLKEEPKIYLPRIFTTALYSIFILYMARILVVITRGVGKEISKAGNIEGVTATGFITGAHKELLFFLVFFLFVYAIDISTYAMYPRIVLDYRTEKKVSLQRALKEALKRFRTLFLIAIFILLFIGVTASLYFFSGALFIKTLNPLYGAIALLTLLAAFVVFALIFFFSVPVAMIENKDLGDVLKRSYILGRQNTGLVLKTNLIFSGLILVTLGVAVYTDFRGGIGIFAILIFLLGRFFQALVYTYISVVNPAVYLELEKV